jgi:uncharacterized protein YutE (UPF0331/DUF86 family)
MSDVDIETLKTKAFAIRENVSKIRQYAGLSDEQFWADERNLLSIKLLMIQIIEDAIAVCSHIMTRRGGQAPSSYPECFSGLARLGVLDSALAERLMAMARFRNLLVHRYWQIDDQRVLELARKDIDDLEAYLMAVGRYLSTAI